MNNTNQLRISRKNEILDRLGISKSPFHNRINDGLFPPPISLGERAVGWPSYEVDEILSYLVAGKTKEAVKTLVCAQIRYREKSIASSSTVYSNALAKYSK